MKRKVFLSFLGTGIYVPVHYQLGEVPSPLLQYVQEAIVNIFKKELNGDDSYMIYIFCTEKATEANWEDNGHKDKEGNPIPSEGLATRLCKDLGNEDFENHVKRVEIPEGFNEEEIWQIFSKVYEVLEEEDEITFDVTHSFRSIPLFSTVLFNYARVMKKVEVKKIYYGAFEKLGPSYQVKEMPEDERIAPIIDMTSIVHLQKTTIAASDFMKFGKMGSLAEVLKSIYKNIDSKRFEEFDFLISTNRIDYIKQGKWKEMFDNVMNSKPIKNNKVLPINELLIKMQDEIKCFIGSEDNRNIESAILWARNHGMIAQALTMAREYVLSVLYNYYEGRFSGTFAEEKRPAICHREYISAIMNISDKDIDSGNFKGYLCYYPELRGSLLKEDIVINLRKPYSQLADERNEVNHGKKGNELSRIDIDSYNKRFDKIWNKIKESLPPTQVKQNSNKPLLFINLSNHPSVHWSEEQLSTAREQYGEIEDMAFPGVPADATEDAITALADEYAGYILEKACEHEVTVHVMGEMTFTMALVSRLMGEGIRCVASTTERDTIDKGDGVKEATFRFVRFRKYLTRPR